MQTCDISTIRSRKRKLIALGLALCILSVFLFSSRYPALISEYHRAENHTLVERDVGALSKDKMLSTDDLTTNVSMVFSTALNWLDTNKIGMGFGIIFAAAILLLMEQSSLLSLGISRRGLRGVFSGLVIGAPLGVCTNCAAPVSLGIKKAGGSYETSFTTLIASPSLNPIGLAIIFLVLPSTLGIMRVSTILLFLVFILPLLVRLFAPEQAKLTASIPKQETKNTDVWFDSIKYCVSRYIKYLGYISIRVLPAMIIIGLLAALLVTYFPLEKLLILESSSVTAIIIAGIVGSLLPVPMFVDVLIVFLLLQLGLPLSIATTLIVTLASTSLFAIFVMGQYVSWRMSLTVASSLCILGISAGLLIHYYQHGTMSNLNNTTLNTQFKPIINLTLKSNYENKRLGNFFGGGVSMVDFNNDGMVDIFIAGNKENTLLLNLGNSKFSDITNKAGISKQLNSVAGIWGDYNNDGYPDLFVVNYIDKDKQPKMNTLYRNNRDGTFSNVTEKVGLIHRDFSSSAAWADYDNDGDLDLFVSNYGIANVTGQNQIAGVSQQDRLYRNDIGKFEDVTYKAGVGGKALKTQKLNQIEINKNAENRGFSFQPVWFDYNNDNLIDLFVTSDFGISQLYKNHGDGRFKNVTEQAGLTAFNTGMGVDVVDINQDGYFDLLVTTTTQNKLWINQKNGSFKDNAKAYGLEDTHRIGWGVSAFDVNNDTNNEVFIVNGLIMKRQSALTEYNNTIDKIRSGNRLFLNGSRSHFSSANSKHQLHNYNMGRGLAIGDINNDGHMDFAITNRDQTHFILYQNQGTLNNSLTIKLVGTKSNRLAIGAKVSVYVNKKVQHKIVSAGTSFLSQHSLVLHFGVGQAKKIDKIVITWPGGQQQTLKNVETTNQLLIKELMR